MAYIGPQPKVGQNREVDDISSGFNGNTTAFTLQVAGSDVSPGNANSIIVSVNNVILNPNTAYSVSGSTITFTSAPTNGQAFFGLVLGQGIDAQTVADQVITNAKISNSAAIAGSKIDPDFSDANAVTKRFMILPKVTTTERGNLTGLESGAFIYNETLNKLQIYNGSAWETVTSST
jgi:hypothetical protein|tara:strand:- start:65 stop:595 length:531 start_codon:yes stop_codon:yes gene_type:complete